MMTVVLKPAAFRDQSLSLRGSRDLHLPPLAALERIQSVLFLRLIESALPGPQRLSGDSCSTLVRESRISSFGFYPKALFWLLSKSAIKMLVDSGQYIRPIAERISGS